MTANVYFLGKNLGPSRIDNTVISFTSAHVMLGHL